MNTRERAWAAHLDVMMMPAPAPHRATATFGPVVCSDLGVPHEWGVMSSAGLGDPTDQDVAAALAWLRDRGAAHGWQAGVPESIVQTHAWPGLVPVDGMPLFATDASTARRIELELPAGLEIDADPTHADVIAGYGGWMADTGLAELLVTPDDVAHPDRRFLVARRDGEAVGCAFIWFAAGTAYLSGIGVVADLRGRGIGRALTAAAARLGAGPGDGRDVDLVWMFATDEGAALYERMGFARIDADVMLSEPPSRA